MGARTTAGYGSFSINGAPAYAHRLSWESQNGPIPDGMFVCHKCDVPCCVNPDHMFLGTHLDNMSDMTSKKRQSCGHGHWVKSNVPGKRFNFSDAAREAFLRTQAKGAAIKRAATHCARGHEFTPENLVTRKRGGKQCRICTNAAARARVQRLKGTTNG